MYPTKFTLGFDRGNHMTDICTLVEDGSGKVTRFEHEDSSAICIGDLKTLQNINDSSTFMSNEKRERPEIAVTYDGSTYFLGRLAWEQGENPNTDIGNRSRYGDEKTLASLLGFSSILLGKINPDLREADLHVVMGMPILTCTQANKEAVRTALNGNHMFICNGKTYNFYVKVLSIMMEGAGAAVKYAVDDTMTDIGFVDTGGLTTNALIYRGPQALGQKCKSTDVGVDSISRRINTEILRMYGRELDPGELECVFRAYTGQVPNYPNLTALQNRKRVTMAKTDLHKVTDQAIKNTGKELRSFLSQLWNDNAQGSVGGKLSKVYYVGGGAPLLKREIEELLGETTIPEDYRKSNVRGYASRAYTISKQIKTVAGR